MPEGFSIESGNIQSYDKQSIQLELLIQTVIQDLLFLQYVTHNLPWRFTVDFLNAKERRNTDVEKQTKIGTSSK